MSKGFACPCCDFLTRSRKESGTFEICPVCLWEDDWIQSQSPHVAGGTNEFSLNEAKENFGRFGVSAEHFKGQNRAPLDDEQPDKPH